MKLKTIIIILVALVILIILVKNWDKVKKFLGFTTPPQGASAAAALDITDVTLSETQATLDALAAAKLAAENTSEGLSQSDELTINKKIQILKLMQKTGHQFTASEYNYLMSMTLADLTYLNTLTVSELQALAYA